MEQTIKHVHNYKTNESEFILLSNSSAIILTSHIWGYLADTKGRKKILAFSMAVGSFFSVLSSFSPDLVTFAALRFIAGLL